MNSPQCRPWADLLTDILRLILNHLLFADYVRFGAVCKSWRSLTANTPHLRALRYPWLAMLDESMLFSTIQNEYIHHGFLNLFYQNNDYLNHLSQNNEYLDLFVMPEYSRCIGSSHGYLVFSSRTSTFHGIHLFNPFTNRYIPLGCKATMFCYPYSIYAHPPTAFRIVNPLTYLCLPHCTADCFNKIILSCPASRHNLTAGNCVAATTFDSSFIAFCRPLDQHWYVVPYRWFLGDFIFIDGLLYCVMKSCHHLVLVEFRSGPNIAFSFAYILMYTIPVYDPFYSEELHLVEIEGEIVLVIRYWDLAEDAPKTFHFGVYKCDLRMRRWVEIGSLGDKMLFRGDVCMLCVDPMDFSEFGFTQNCIYFTDGELDEYRWLVFSLEDRMIQPFSPANSFSIRSPHLWIRPSDA